jgi:hypothetical protein
VALWEVDATLLVPLARDATLGRLLLGVGAAAAIPGDALIGDQPAQRLFVCLVAETAASASAHLAPR